LVIELFFEPSVVRGRLIVEACGKRLAASEVLVGRRTYQGLLASWSMQDSP